MDDKRKIVDRGRRAAAVINLDSVVMEALTDLENRYTNEWKNSKVDEVVVREKAFVAVLVLDDIKTQLQTYADRGKYAEKQLQKDQVLQ